MSQEQRGVKTSDAFGKYQYAIYTPVLHREKQPSMFSPCSTRGSGLRSHAFTSDARTRGMAVGTVALQYVSVLAEEPWLRSTYFFPQKQSAFLTTPFNTVLLRLKQIQPHYQVLKHSKQHKARKRQRTLAN